MRHLKTYENNVQGYWILHVIDYFEIHVTEESAENSLINMVNGAKEQLDYEEDEFSYEWKEALEWYRDYYESERIYIKLSEFYPNKVELGEEAEKLRTINNYNL